MSDDLVRGHYEDDHEGGIVERVTRALRDMRGPLTSARLAGFDQFHARGFAATAELAALLGLNANDAVLDAGSGLGGPSRFIAQTYGCKVTGIDLTPSYVVVARLLAERTGLADRVDYEVGNLLALGCKDATFDAVYTQHVVMNIRDRAGAYREIRRVLKPGGRFGFYDVLAGDDKVDPFHPVPWAETPATSVLLTEMETEAVLSEAGLTPDPWQDVSGPAIEWFATRPPANAAAPNLSLVMGSRFGEMAANFVRNLRERRVRLMMGTCTARG